jgi:hypothetical protein
MAEDGEKTATPGGAAVVVEGGGGKEVEESVKLFVGQLPKHMTEPELVAMFLEVAAVDEVTVIKDKATKVARTATAGAPLSTPQTRHGLSAAPWSTSRYTSMS